MTEYNASWQTYCEAIESILRFYAITHGQVPEWICVPYKSPTECPNKFYQRDWEDAINRVQAYINKNGKNPPNVWFRNIQTTTPSFTEWYQSMIGHGYESYMSDVYSSSEEDYNITNHIAMNCTDYSQKAKEIAESRGYEWRFIHRICASGTGHILGQIRGREFSDWTIIDVAAAASIGSQYPIGKSWCENYSEQWISTEQWLMTNDGEFEK